MMGKYFSMMSMMASMTMTAMAWMTTTKEKIIMAEWEMMKFIGMEMKMNLMMDHKSSMFSACVMLITTAVMIYSNYYMKESKKKTSFMKMISAFIMSMMVLIFSSNMTSAILGWEGLGMTSFILIMYYQNTKSMNSSFYTMMMNRMGDIMMMMSMINMMSMNSWNFKMMEFNYQTMTMMMLATASFSKSAQIPFSSWLTEAMAAPTPISALVHSSTLVTAGVFILIRMESILKYKSMKIFIFMTSMTTLIMASMNSITEWDIKKMIALSTLSQISMMFITISLNLFNLAMFHLLVHATFKALIFLCSSSFISIANTQDIRKMNKSSKNMFLTKLSMNTATLTLMGFPFMSSFYSKEMIMEMMLIKKMNTMMIMMFYACMVATIFYSLKMLNFTNQKPNKKTMTPLKENSEQKTSKLILLMPSVLFGNKVNWLMNINFKIPHLSKLEKMLPTLIIIMMILNVTEMMKSAMNTNTSNSTMKIMMNYMWFMKNLSTQMKKSLMTKFFKMFKNSEKMIFNEMIKSLKKTLKNQSKNNFWITHKNPMKINMTVMMMITVLV